MINIDRIIHINQSLVYLSGEKSIHNSNLDFAIDEYNHSKQIKVDLAKLIYRINSTHAFTNGNKRTCTAIMQMFYEIDIERTKECLKYIADNILSVEESKAIKMIGDLLI